MRVWNELFYTDYYLCTRKSRQKIDDGWCCNARFFWLHYWWMDVAQTHCVKIGFAIALELKKKLDRYFSAFCTLSKNELTDQFIESLIIQTNKQLYRRRISYRLRFRRCHETRANLGSAHYIQTPILMKDWHCVITYCVYASLCCGVDLDDTIIFVDQCWHAHKKIIFGWRCRFCDKLTAIACRCVCLPEAME